MENRREHRRTSVVKSGTVFYNNGNSSVPCVILDQSETGAKIQINVHELFECPLMFKFKHFDIIRECRRIWSNKNIIGFEYV